MINLFTLFIYLEKKKISSFHPEKCVSYDYREFYVRVLYLAYEFMRGSANKMSVIGDNQW